MDATRAAIDGSLYLNDRFSAKGEVKLLRAVIAGQFACTNATFDHPNGRALNADEITVAASVFLRDGFSAKGEVNLRGSRINGQLNCAKGRFDNPSGKALTADAIKVRDSVFLSNGFVAMGEVNLVRATIEGQFSCTGGTFDNAGSRAIDADAITVAADVFLRLGFVVRGEVNFRRASVNGNMQCEGGSFANEGGDAFDLSLAKIGGGLFLNDLKIPESGSRAIEGRLLLSQTRCRTYRDDPQSWPAPGKLVLDGFTYDRFDDCATDWKIRRAWLERQDKDHLNGSFRPQPWTHAIDVLRTMGHESDAKELAICREIARSRSQSTKAFLKFWYFLLWLFVGYGYRPWRAVWWSAAFIAIAWWVFASAASLGYMAPRDGNVRVTPEWNVAKPGTQKLPWTYPPFNGLVYALDDYLPVIEFGQDEAWEPSTKKTIVVIHSAPDMLGLRYLPTAPEWLFTSGWHRVLYWIEEFLGWVFVSLFIAGMSGLMKKE
jgi:hypothetical protein